MSRTSTIGEHQMKITDAHEKIIQQYIILLRGQYNTSAKSLRKFANRKLREGWYVEDEREILNTMRFEVVNDKKRKLKNGKTN
jgi:hypothetical protein